METKQANQNSLFQKNVPLQNKNWFQTGGSARFFAHVSTQQEFQQALEVAHTEELDLFVLGGGANVLISDNGFDGLVIHTKLEQITHDDLDELHVLVHAGAGVQMKHLINYCLQNNIVGLEEFSGIPGTIGGAVYNNMHYFEFLLSHFLHGGTVIEQETGQIKNVAAKWFQLGYDHSKLHEKKQYLLSGTFKLKKATDLETAYAQGRTKEMQRHRFTRYPTARTCGCFFRNFHPNEVSMTVPGTDRKMIYVAYYLDKIGVKGTLCVGDAVVSHQHANMLINKGNATSTDLVKLARTMQEQVCKHYGILPQPECELVGFKKYPLLTT